MFPVIFIAAVAPSPSLDNPPVHLDDALRFQVHPQAAHSLYLLARDHLADRQWCIREHNPPEVYEQWWCEQRWRIQVWSDLEDLLYYRHDGECGLSKLRRLRDCIGHRDYYAGRMPDPMCQYVWRER